MKSVPSRAAPYYAGMFALATVLSVVMLATDTNLRTDFGAMPSGYFAHWYVILVTAIVDALGALLLVVMRNRLAVLGGTVGAALLVVVLLGAIFTYSQVGFDSASQFADYLFGVTYFGGDIRYLYDAVLATYFATFLVGVAILLHEPSGRPAPETDGSAGPAP
jgi:uncharacterized membrane protein YjdF